MTETQNRVHAGIPAGGQFAKTAHSDSVPALGGIPVTAGPVVDPTRPYRSYVITKDEDGELHYDAADSDYAMQHKEPVTRSEVLKALACPKLTGRKGRVVDLGWVTTRGNVDNDDHYDVVGPESGAPLVVRVKDGFHLLHVRSGNVHIEVQKSFGGGVDVHGGTADIIVDGRNKYAVETHNDGRARIALSEQSRVRVWAQGTSATYVTGGGNNCTITSYNGAVIHQDGPEEKKLPVRHAEIKQRGRA